MGWCELLWKKVIPLCLYVVLQGKVHLLCPPATTCSSFTKKVQNLLSTREISLETLDSEVTVADFGFEMVCNLVLPEECRNVRHFDIIGHVAQIGLTFHFDSKDYAKVAGTTFVVLALTFLRIMHLVFFILSLVIARKVRYSLFDRRVDTSKLLPQSLEMLFSVEQ